MSWNFTIRGSSFQFKSLKEVLAKASPERSGDSLARLAAISAEERIAAQFCLADTFLSQFVEEELIPANEDEITRLIQIQWDSKSFSKISHHTVGSFREFLLDESTTGESIADIRYGLTPEMIAAVSKIMSIQDMVLVSQKIQIITAFRNTLGLKGRLSVRLQPNHPMDDPKGVMASVLDGLLLGAGDAVIGINPVTDNPKNTRLLLQLLDDLRENLKLPTQSCVLCHLTTSMELMKEKAPLDLVFQSIGGSQKLNESFGINLTLLKEAYDQALDLNRGTIGNNVMYFETGQGSGLSANAHFGIDQQTLEVRAYAVAREFSPLLVNSVVGFIGPEYLFNGKQIIRAGVEDHFCGKMMGLPMGVDVCYTNHAEADSDDMDVLLSLLGLAGCNYIMGVPASDDVMLSYQSTSFHDALYLRQVLGLKPAPEFENWLNEKRIFSPKTRLPLWKESNPALLDGESL